MGANAIRSHNTKVYRKDLGAGPFVLVEEVLDVTPPSLVRSIINATSQSDNFPYKVVGMPDSENFQFDINFSPGLASHEALIDSYQAEQVDEWQIEFSNLETWVFSGALAGISPSAPLDDVVKASITVAVWGDVVRS